jgi:dTMP kinase
MKDEPGRPLFVSLDGLDGTGKSTQCCLLADWLRQRGFQVVSCADPGGTGLGDALRKLLLHHRQEIALPCETFLFMASRAQLVDEIIRPALEAGKAVVSDRFLLANVVYQGHAGGLNVEKLWDLGRLSTDGLEPDLTLVLDLPLDLAQQRRSREPDRLESRGKWYQQRVREGFLTEAQRRPDRVRVIDARPNIAAVHELICKEVLRVLGTGPRS